MVTTDALGFVDAELNVRSPLRYAAFSWVKCLSPVFPLVDVDADADGDAGAGKGIGVGG